MVNKTAFTSMCIPHTKLMAKLYHRKNKFYILQIINHSYPR